MTTNEKNSLYELLYDYECLINQIEEVSKTLDQWEEGDSRDGVAVCVYALRGLVATHKADRDKHYKAFIFGEQGIRQPSPNN